MCYVHTGFSAFEIWTHTLYINKYHSSTQTSTRVNICSFNKISQDISNISSILCRGQRWVIIISITWLIRGHLLIFSLFQISSYIKYIIFQGHLSPNFKYRDTGLIPIRITIILPNRGALISQAAEQAGLLLKKGPSWIEGQQLKKTITFFN